MSTNSWIEKRKILSFWDAYDDGEGSWWVSNISSNGIFKISTKDFSSQFVNVFSGESVSKGLHKQIVLYKDYLIFIPELAENVAFYDKKSGNIKYVSIKTKTSVKNEMKVGAARICRNELWLFPQFISQNVLIIDLQSLEVNEYKKINQFVTQINEHISNIVYANPIFVENIVWIPIKNTNQMIRYDMQNDNLRVFFLKDKEMKINCVSYDSDFFWLTFSDRLEVCRWSPEADLEKMYVVDVEWDKKAAPFSYIIKVQEEQYLIMPAHTEYVILLDGERIKTLEYPKGFYWIDDFKKNWSRITAYRVAEDSIYLFPVVGNMLLKYNIDSQNLVGEVCRVPKEWDDEYIYRNVIQNEKIGERLSRDNCLYEGKEVNLEHFMAYIHQYIGKK